MIMFGFEEQDEQKRNLNSSSESSSENTTECDKCVKQKETF